MLRLPMEAQMAAQAKEDEESSRIVLLSDLTQVVRPFTPSSVFDQESGERLPNVTRSLWLLHDGNPLTTGKNFTLHDQHTFTAGKQS